jgi:WD40 repeat protein
LRPFSPDGTLLASGSNEGTVKIWDVATGNLLRTLEGHSSLIESVAFSPDGNLLAAGGFAGRISIWGIGVAKTVKR